MNTLLDALKGVAEASRLRIIALLGREELTVTELTDILGQSQPRVSRHLKLLVDAGLLYRFKEGSWTFYRLCDEESVQKLLKTILDLIPENNPEYIRDLEKLLHIRKERAINAQSYFAKNAENWDRIRSLYVEDETVESEILKIINDRKFSSLIDVGTGTGRILELLSPLIERGMGIDQSREMLSVARSNLSASQTNNCQVRLGDMYDLPVLGKTQNLAIMHQVLHFASEPIRALEEISRVLTPSGEAIIVDFAPHNQEFLRDEHAHRRLGFSNNEIDSMAKAAGLTVNKFITLSGGQLGINLWHLLKNEGQ